MVALATCTDFFLFIFGLYPVHGFLADYPVHCRLKAGHLHPHVHGMRHWWGPKAAWNANWAARHLKNKGLTKFGCDLSQAASIQECRHGQATCSDWCFMVLHNTINTVFVFVSVGDAGVDHLHCEVCFSSLCHRWPPLIGVCMPPKDSIFVCQMSCVQAAVDFVFRRPDWTLTLGQS